MIIDFHSHVLPGIDDGSKDTKMSMQMLSMAGSQGVDVMIATPHFYSWRHRVDDFLSRRTASYEHLMDVIGQQDPAQTKNYPKILLGAEVAYFDGISKAERLDDLRIQGTNILLLEMSFEPWSPNMLKEVEYLIRRRGYTIVLAHLERYLRIKENRLLIEKIMTLPLEVQVSADSLTGFFYNKDAMMWLKEGKARILASDAHNTDKRKPNLLDGREAIEKRAGREVLEQIDRTSSEMLQELFH